MGDLGLRALILFAAWIFVVSASALLAISAWRRYADPARRAAALTAIISGAALVLLLVTARAVVPPPSQIDILRQAPFAPGAGPGQQQRPPAQPGGRPGAPAQPPALPSPSP